MLAVILSAVLHATWNVLLRRAGGSTTVIALSKVAEAVLLIPVAVVAWLAVRPVAIAPYAVPVVVAAILALVNYAALTAAYRRADLSLVYPIARGGVFLFLPLLGFAVFGERLGLLGWTALGLIVGGIVLLPMERFDARSSGVLLRHLRERFVGFALLAAAATATYTIWDKYAVGFLDTILYFHGYTVLLALWFGGVLVRTPRDEIRREWRAQPVSIVMIGVLNAAAYLLILVALRTGMATQVLAVRQLSIAFGVWLGWRLLHESVTAPRAAGAALITAGCLLAAAM